MKRSGTNSFEIESEMSSLNGTSMDSVLHFMDLPILVPLDAISETEANADEINFDLGDGSDELDEGEVPVVSTVLLHELGLIENFWSNSILFKFKK